MTPATDRDLVVRTTTEDGIATIRLNNPRKLNAWSPAMLEAMGAQLKEAAADADVKAVILTGTGKYYCAGVDFAGSLKPMHPRKLKELIRANNYAIFDQFIDFPKPIFVAANGPAVGAPVTSASLTDGIIASTGATFNTPFKKIGVVPEGCSSFNFPRMMGEENAKRFLENGDKITADEALKMGLLVAVAPPDELEDAALQYARDWLAEGKGRAIADAALIDKLKEVNAEESIALAEAICDYPFLDGMIKFTYAKRKWVPLLTFIAIRGTRPLWSRL